MQKESMLDKVHKDVLLRFLEREDTIEMAMQKAKEEMDQKKKNLLEEHKKHHKISVVAEKGKTPRYTTVVTMPNGRYKTLRKTRLCDLEDAICDFYLTAKSDQIASTLESIYDKWLALRRATKSGGTVAKDVWIWQKYYYGTDFVKKDIRCFTVPEITTWLVDRAKKFGLTTKKFREMKSLLNSLLDYAVQMLLIPYNSSREIHGISNEIFCEEVERQSETQVFCATDQIRLIAFCCEAAVRTSNSAYYCIVLNFFLGLRVGELVAVKFCDIDFENRTLKVCRSETNRYADCNGRIARDGFEVRNHLKSGVKERVVSLPDEAIAVIKQIQKINAANGVPDSEWLCIRKDGCRMHKCTITDTLRRTNRKLGLQQRSNHKIRKTVLSKMIQSGMFSRKEIQDQAGHKDASTTDKYYAFALSTPASRAEKVDTVLGVGIENFLKPRE